MSNSEENSSFERSYFSASTLFQLVNKINGAFRSRQFFLGCTAIRSKCKCLNIRQMHHCTHMHTYITRIHTETCHNRKRIVNLIKNFSLCHRAIQPSAFTVCSLQLNIQNGSHDFSLIGLNGIELN